MKILDMLGTLQDSVVFFVILFKVFTASTQAYNIAANRTIETIFSLCFQKLFLLTAAPWRTANLIFKLSSLRASKQWQYCYKVGRGVQPRRLNCNLKMIAFSMGSVKGGAACFTCHPFGAWTGISYILPTAPVQQLYQLLLLLVID